MNEQCVYDKPHPKHHWWIDGKTAPITNYRNCEGIPEPRGTTIGTEGSGYLTHTKQALGEFELWEREQRHVGAALHIANARHLHFLFLRGHWEWVLRWSKSGLCGTPRCRRVIITEEEAHEQA